MLTSHSRQEDRKNDYKLFPSWERIRVQSRKQYLYTLPLSVGIVRISSLLSVMMTSVASIDPTLSCVPYRGRGQTTQGTPGNSFLCPALYIVPTKSISTILYFCFYLWSVGKTPPKQNQTNFIALQPCALHIDFYFANHVFMFVSPDNRSLKFK